MEHSLISRVVSEPDEPFSSPSSRPQLATSAPYQSRPIGEDWNKGDIVDAWDESTNIFCPAQIIKKENGDNYRIHWLGWDASFDSSVNAADIFPEGTYVLKSTGWVRLDKKIGWWPAVIFLRLPKPGTTDGPFNLTHTSSMYVEPCLPTEVNSSSLQRHRKGFWARIWDISNFQHGASAKRSRNLCSKAFGPDFENSLDIVDTPSIPDLEFELEGSLCISIKVDGQVKILAERSNQGQVFEIAPMDEQSETETEDDADSLFESASADKKKKGKKQATSSFSGVTKKRKRKEETKVVKAEIVDTSVGRVIKKNIAAMKGDKMDMSWTIQDHFESYYNSLDWKYKNLTKDGK